MWLESWKAYVNYLLAILTFRGLDCQTAYIKILLWLTEDFCRWEQSFLVSVWQRRIVGSYRPKLINDKWGRNLYTPSTRGDDNNVPSEVAPQKWKLNDKICQYSVDSAPCQPSPPKIRSSSIVYNIPRKGKKKKPKMKGHTALHKAGWQASLLINHRLGSINNVILIIFGRRKVGETTTVTLHFITKN